MDGREKAALASLEAYEASVDERALRKLQYIIDREGDAGGERRKPYYLEQLKTEIMAADALTARCMAAHTKRR